MSKKLSIYIHYPFCKSKCPYCDFNSHVYSTIDDNRFLKAYLAELEFFAPRILGAEIKTIFFGGGTPSLMPVKLVERLIDKIAKIWSIGDNCEISLEANPTSFEANKFRDFSNAGVNRLSIGIQALNDQDLKFLGREHSAAEAIKTIEIAQTIFNNYSFDLIYMRPNQTLNDWESELKKAIAICNNHLSLYGLTIERGTKFYGQYDRGEFVLPDQDLAAEFYQLTSQISKDNGLNLYEVSNHARNGYECQHNLAYWRSEDYLGIGAGAHSRVSLDGNKARMGIVMAHEPNAWLKKVEQLMVGIQTIEPIKINELLKEVVIMGLRLKDGIDNKVFKKFFDKNIDEIFDAKKLEFLKNNYLIDFDSNRIAVTDHGRLLSNSIINKLLNSARLDSVD